MQDKKIAALTLGCKVNQQETDSILTLFEHYDYKKVEFVDKADVYIINTCTVTHLGDRKSRQMIRRAVQNNPDATIVVTGCYAQRDAEEILQIPGVDIVIGTKNRSVLPELVEKTINNKGQKINAVSDIMITEEFEEISAQQVNQGRVRAYLKIQEGCNQFCTYCIIPYTRGPVRSRSMENVLREAENLVENGYKELVLTGIHTAAYGAEDPSGPGLGELVRELVKLDKLQRLRISSIDPHEFGENLLEAIMANPKICPHFHIPLQSGSDKILMAMNRPYDTAFYKNIVERLRKINPDLSISTDIMVGFPGETQVDFDNSAAFCEEISFSSMHIFKYSARSGTPAAEFAEQVSPNIKEERSKKLFLLSKRMWANFAERFMADTLDVLVEHKGKNDLWEGHSPEYLKVVFKLSDDLRGEIVPVKITGLGDGFLEGSVRR